MTKVKNLIAIHLNILKCFDKFVQQLNQNKIYYEWFKSNILLLLSMENMI